MDTQDGSVPARWPLLALATGAFGIGTTEFSPMGLLPVMARGLDVSVPVAGQLVTAYAVGVMVGAPLMTLLLVRLRRKMALVALMAVFTVGNLLSGIAPGYNTLLAARVLTSLAHGAYFGLGSVAAAALVPPARQAGALATMFMGLTVANVGGVPAATWLGHLIGWRMSFVAIAGLGLIAMAALLWALPPGEAGRRPDVWRELRVMARPGVQAALLTTSLFAGSVFTLYTYVAPVLQRLCGATPAFVTAMLVLVGVGFTIGNAVGGRLADRSLRGSLLGFLLLLAATLALFPVVAASQAGAAVGLLVWGIATFALVPPLQIRVMQVAHEAPGLASSINVGAFNFGNALGAALGGAVLSAGFGYATVPVAGAVLSAAALLLVLVVFRGGNGRNQTNKIAALQQ
jgi:MFS transporter, DHA1 family, inner membrane transport protein